MQLVTSTVVFSVTVVLSLFVTIMFPVFEPVIVDEAVVSTSLSVSEYTDTLELVVRIVEDSVYSQLETTVVCVDTFPEEFVVTSPHSDEEPTEDPEENAADEADDDSDDEAGDADDEALDGKVDIEEENETVELKEGTAVEVVEDENAWDEEGTTHDIVDERASNETLELEGKGIEEASDVMDIEDNITGEIPSAEPVSEVEKASDETELRNVEVDVVDKIASVEPVSEVNVDNMEDKASDETELDVDKDIVDK